MSSAASNITNNTNTSVSSSRNDTQTSSLSASPSAKPGAITSWGSTSGKLYLSSPRLDDPKTTSTVTHYFSRGQAKADGGTNDESAKLIENGVGDGNSRGSSA